MNAQNTSTTPVETPQTTDRTPDLQQVNEKNWAMAAHLSTLVGFIVPFGNLIGPFVVWQIKKDESSVITHHAKESLNFQITVSIAGLIAAILTIVLIGFLLVPAIYLAALIFVILATIAANKGQLYRYPISIRFIS